MAARLTPATAGNGLAVAGKVSLAGVVALAEVVVVEFSVVVDEVVVGVVASGFAWA